MIARAALLLSALATGFSPVAVDVWSWALALAALALVSWLPTRAALRFVRGDSAPRGAPTSVR